MLTEQINLSTEEPDSFMSYDAKTRKNQSAEGKPLLMKLKVESYIWWLENLSLLGNENWNSMSIF